MEIVKAKVLEAEAQAPAAILCATDFSPAANQACEIAVALASGFGARLELVHVIQLPMLSSPAASARLMGLLRDGAEKELAGKVDALSGRGAEVSGRVELGSVDEILESALARLTPSLLVLGNHGRAGLNRFVGSVAERSITRARCPVLVVPPAPTTMRGWLPGRRPLRITALVDRSLATEAVAETLQTFSRAVACELNLVHPFWPRREHEQLGLRGGDVGGAAEELVDAVLGRELRARVGHVLQSPGREAPIRLCAVAGDDTEPLLNEAHANGADMIVLGVNQHAAGAAMATLRSADLPVLCVPAPDQVEHALHTELPPVRSVLVPFDFSPLASEALPHAYRLVRRGGKVVIVHVVEAGPVGLDPDVRADLERDLAGYIPQQSWASGDVSRTLVYEAHDAADGILQVARRLGVDLIVMSSHGRTGLRRAFVGSVAEAVIRRAALPVVVVPAPEREPS